MSSTHQITLSAQRNDPLINAHMAITCCICCLAGCAHYMLCNYDTLNNLSYQLLRETYQKEVKRMKENENAMQPNENTTFKTLTSYHMN